MKPLVYIIWGVLTVALYHYDPFKLKSAPPATLSHKAQCLADMKRAASWAKNDQQYESLVKPFMKEGRWICHTLGPVLVKGK